MRKRKKDQTELKQKKNPKGYFNRKKIRVSLAKNKIKTNKMKFFCK